MADTDQPATNSAPPRTSRGLLVLLVAFAVLLVPPIVVGWTYLQRQSAYQTDRNVRALDTFGRQFTAAVQAYGTIVARYMDNGARDDLYTQVPLLSVRHASYCFAADPAANLKGRPFLTYAPNDAAALYLGYESKERTEIVEGKRVPARLCVRAEVADLLGDVKEDRFFDGTFFSDATGIVLYQDGKSSVRLNHFGTEKPTPAPEKNGKDTKSTPAKSGESSSLLAATDQTEMNPSGINYKVFTRPVRLPLPLRHFDDREQPHPDVEWLLGGFVERARFDRETRELPASLVSGVPFLLLLVVLAWPALKLWSLSSRERIRWIDVHLLALCTVLGVAWMTVGVVHLYARHQMRERVDNDLTRLSRTITRNLFADLRDARINLATFIRAQRTPMEDAVRDAKLGKKSDTTGSHNDKKTAVSGRKRPDCASKGNPDIENLLRCETPPLVKKFTRRPYFDMLLWADSNAEQRVKWTTLDANTPRINMSSVAVFKQTQEGTLDAIPVGTKPRRFAFQVFPSPITNNAIAVLARPKSRAERLSVEGRQNFIYAAIVPHLRSVIGPVLPLDYGFAIIRPDGDVWLHSDSRRNTRENFYTEAGAALFLKSAIGLAKTARVDTEYHGLDHRMLVTPLRNLDLSLVVFHDETMLGVLQAEMLMSSGVMLIGCILLYFVSVLIALALWPEAGEWVWPDASRVGVYYRGIIVCSALSVYVAWFVFTQRGLRVIAASLLAVTIGEAFVFFQLGHARGQWSLSRRVLPSTMMLLAAVLCAAMARTTADWFVFAAVFSVVIAMFWWPPVNGRRSQTELVWAYCGLWVSVIILVAVMPSLAIFKDAYGHVTETLVRAGEVQFAQELGRRGQSVAARYAPVAYLEGENLVQSALVYRRDVYRAPYLLGQHTRYASREESPGELTTGSTGPGFSLGVVGWFFKGTCFDREDDEECQLFRRHPAALVSSVFPVYNAVTSRLRQLVYESAGDDRWSTARSGDTRQTLDATAWNVRYGYYTSGDEGLGWMKLTSQVPPLELPKAAPAWVLLTVFAGVWLLLTGRLVHWIGSELFGLERWYDDAPGEPPPSAQERQEATPAGESPTANGRTENANVRTGRRRWRWPGDDQESLERLLHDECGNDVVLRRIADEIRNRKDRDTLSHEQVLELIGDRAQSYYERRWGSFGPQRKLALVQLAQGGFVNPHNWDELRAAHREGLVRRTPAVRFVSEAFRRFVAAVESPAQVAKWEASDVERSWTDSRTIASSAVVIGAVALVLTRPDVFESWVAIATGVVGGVPVFMRLIGLASSRGDAKKSQG